MSQKRLTSEEVEAARLMWSDGASLNDLATALGRSLDSIARMIDRNRELFPYRQKHVGEWKHYVMCALRREGWDIRRIARYMDVSTTCVCNHVRGVVMTGDVTA